MRRLEIPDLPEGLYEHLVKAATKRGVSPEQEAADRLSKTAENELAEAALLEAVRRERDEWKGPPLTEDNVNTAKRWGRE